MRMLSKISFAIISLVLFSSISMAQTGTVEGYVLDDSDAPVVGVEVFLGIFTDPFENRYTCTDATGYFAFTGVPNSVDLVSVTGPAVDTAAGCPNDLFVDSTNTPYIIQYYDNGSTPSEIVLFAVADSPISFTLSTWQTEGNRTLDALIRGAHRILSQDFGRDYVRFDRQVNRIIDTTNRLERTGRISTSAANAVRATAANYSQVGR